MSWDDSDKQVKNGGGYFNIQPGDNKVRVVSEPAFIHTHWKDKKPSNCVGQDKGCALCSDVDEKVSTVKTTFMFHVLDRADGKTKVAEFGASVYRQIREFQKAGEYAYTDKIAPYDINIKKTGSGLGTEYTVLPARQNTELTAEEKAEVEKLKPINEFRDKTITARSGEGADEAKTTEQDKKDIEEMAKEM